jgi:hypothetical protein
MRMAERRRRKITMETTTMTIPEDPGRRQSESSEWYWSVFCA